MFHKCTSDRLPFTNMQISPEVFMRYLGMFKLRAVELHIFFFIKQHQQISYAFRSAPDRAYIRVKNATFLLSTRLIF